MTDSTSRGKGSTDADEAESNNSVVNAWNRLKSDIDTQQLREVIRIENGRPKIDPVKAKKLAEDQNKWTIKGATGGAIIGALISVSGAMSIPLAAAGAALGYALDKDAVDQVEVLEEDFQMVLEAIEDEEEVDLSRLAMITHIKKDTLSEEYLPYLEEQGFVKFNEENEVVVLSKPVLQQAMSYIRR